MDVDSTLWGSNLEFFKYMFNSTDKNNKQAQVKNILFLFLVMLHKNISDSS